MKLFRTSNTEIIVKCQHYFGFSLPSKLVEIKRNKCVNNYNNVPLLKNRYGYHLTVGLSYSSLSSVYLFRFQLYLLSVFATMIMVNKDYHCIQAFKAHENSPTMQFVSRSAERHNQWAVCSLFTLLFLQCFDTVGWVI